MKQLFALGVVMSLTLGCTSQKENEMKTHEEHGQHHEHQHGDHGHQHSPQASAELIVSTDPGEPRAGQPVTLRMMIHAADGTMVNDFEVVHQEKVHLVIVREGLDHFDHIHPMVDGKGSLTVTHTFPVGGKYRLFADYTPTGGGHATATGSVVVDGESPPAPALVPNAPGNVDADGIQAAISAEPLRVGEMVKVTFSLTDENGEPAELEPYMGALGQLMFVSAAGKYVHVHPAAEDPAEGKVEFEAHFPESGLYKGWGQFKRDDRVRVVPLVVEVN